MTNLTISPTTVHPITLSLERIDALFKAIENSELEVLRFEKCSYAFLRDNELPLQSITKTKLKSLYIHNDPEHNPELIGFLRKILNVSPDVERLSLRQNNIFNLWPNSVFDSLVQSVKNSSITYLDLGDNILFYTHLPSFRELVSHPNIRRINFENCFFRNNAFQVIAETLPSSNIETLVLLNNFFVSDEGVLALIRNLATSKVTRLDLRGIILRPATISAIFEAMNNGAVVSELALSLSFTHDEVRAIAHGLSPNPPYLRKLLLNEKRTVASSGASLLFYSSGFRDLQKAGRHANVKVVFYPYLENIFEI